MQGPVMAQLKASFTMSKSAGCSPLTVFFNNTTAASSSAVYEWNFGNGNTSSLKNAGAVFLDEKDYTVTLTVKDGNQTSTQTQIVSVYHKPVVDFSSSQQKVCSPDPVTFTANATADKGSIVSYLWDFGDGFTQQSYNAQINHTYSAVQKPSVTLSVTDNHGCSNLKTIDNLVEVLQGSTASFNADKTFICFQTDPVQMINTSSGEAPLSYSWDFGDGVTSSDLNPIHIFNKKGIYSVRLTVEGASGCKNTLDKTAYLNVGEFKSEITVQDIICKNAPVELKNTSVPAPTSFSWLVDNVQRVYPDYSGKYNYTFSTAGTHTIELTNQFGTCQETISKKVEIKELPQPKGFITQIPEYCSPPVIVIFTDTTSGIVKSEWNFDGNYYPFIEATGTTVSHAYTQPYNWYASLVVTDANGCKNSTQKMVSITRPYVYIQATDNNGMYGCDSLTKKFQMIASEELASYEWNFGDGTTSTEATPEHTFKTGSYTITLKYTTAKECTGNAYLNNVNVYGKPKADFTATSGTTVCGNSIVNFKVTTNSGSWDNWYIDGNYGGNTSNSTFTYQFADTGKYTVTVIAYNYGCRDTMTRTDYITVLPPFSKITGSKNTCDDDRGSVTLSQASREAEKWTWNFGDGTTTTYDTDEPEITHHYTKSGQYQVSLTTYNAQCANTASTNIIVLLKQYPILSSSKTNICAEEPLNYTLSNLNMQAYSYYYTGYFLQNYQYNDGATFSSGYDWITTMPFYGAVGNLQKGKDSIRIITRDGYFSCLDTSNFIPIKISGAAAGFEILTNNVCFKSPVTFRDTSNAQNTTILSRQWNFGDGQTQTTTASGIVSHTYANPGVYYVSLKITDAAGCTSSTNYATHPISVSGPKAAFSISEVNAHLNATIYFYNNTNYYNSYNTEYDWRFGDGGLSSQFSPSYTYTKAGNYEIMLIAKNPQTGCTDTAYQKITVANFNVNFSFATSFVNSIECSPTLVQFRNTSVNYTHVKWDFGDGSTADNVNYPSHLYKSAGTYIIKLFVTGYNGLSNTYTDSVIITNRKANIVADIHHSCTSQSVTLSAITENASSYLWDFGDGTLVQATDTFSVHYYQRPGTYLPKLIVKDSLGCAVSVALNDQIAIDSLYVSLKNLPQKVCAPKEVIFNPVIENIGQGGTQAPLIYHWNFGSNSNTDTSNIETPSFIYQQPGAYTVSLKVQSPYGCVKEATNTILALQGLGGQINGPAEICQESTVQFTGSTLVIGQPQWHWIFDDGTVAEQQNPPPRTYNNAGIFTVQLIVDNNGCIDTVKRALEVYAKPTVSLSSTDEVLCEGSATSITASGGSSYIWSPSTGLNSTTDASIIATPLSNTNYLVTATDAHGCRNTGILKITVIHPFTLQLAPEASVCSGKSIEIKASGAVTYQWIRDTGNLNSTTIPNPVATPSVTTTYTVAAMGENQCFTDTASITIRVQPSPVIDAGPGAEIPLGTSYQLQPQGSNDIVKWDWFPREYLNCFNCATPIATPLEPMNYTVTVANLQGCSSSDTVSIKLFCSESRIFIPTAFTPNNDGLNDQFSIKGQGISIVKRLRIYDRWGSLVFERANFKIDDKSTAWDGRYKGEPVPMGVYVYFVEMSCNEKTFTQKGSVTVMY